MTLFQLLSGVLVTVNGQTDRPQISVAAEGTCVAWYGEARCWGHRLSMDPEYKDSDSTEYITEPPSDAINFGSPFIVDRVFAGYNHSCAVSTDGNARCWGLNTFGQLGYGNTEDFSASSNFGNDVDLGTGFVVDDGGVGRYHSCFLSTNHSVKCFGSCGYGQCGYGDELDRGDDSEEMGDYLDTVDLGEDFEPIQLTVGEYHNCALSSSQTIKCWGMNMFGQLGLGDDENRGDGPGEMGANLPELDLGYFEPIQVVAGRLHTCAKTQYYLKCWGFNGNGQLGLGDNTDRGNLSSHMGNNLPTVSLGTTQTGALAVTLGSDHTCVIAWLWSNPLLRVKCFGLGTSGQLGYGDTRTRGDGSNEMGVYLPYLDLGNDFNVSYLSNGFSGRHTCAVSNKNVIRCWGANGYYQLGTNDTDDRGDDDNEELPIVNLTRSYLIGHTAPPTPDLPTTSPSVTPPVAGWVPTQDPTLPPVIVDPPSYPVPTLPPVIVDPPSHTFDPTSEPTVSPSIGPTARPSQPTVEPTPIPSPFPTTFPTTEPTMAEKLPSESPSTEPTKAPSEDPTVSPSKDPTDAPSRSPSRNQSESPSTAPSEYPSADPSNAPSRMPSEQEFKELVPTTQIIELDTVALVVFVGCICMLSASIGCAALYMGRRRRARSKGYDAQQQLGVHVLTMSQQEIEDQPEGGMGSNSVVIVMKKDAKPEAVRDSSGSSADKRADKRSHSTAANAPHKDPEIRADDISSMYGDDSEEKKSQFSGIETGAFEIETGYDGERIDEDIQSGPGSPKRRGTSIYRKPSEVNTDDGFPRQGTMGAGAEGDV